jgi:hypothetical protein
MDKHSPIMNIQPSKVISPVYYLSTSKKAFFKFNPRDKTVL